MTDRSDSMSNDTFLKSGFQGNDSSTSSLYSQAEDDTCASCEPVEHDTKEGAENSENPSLNSLSIESVTCQPILPLVSITSAATIELQALQVEVGPFSYYLLPGMQVIVHPEDEKALQNTKKLQDAIEAIFIKCNAEKIVTVIVEKTSLDACFSSREIGSKLKVGCREQSIGLYLCHGSGKIFWLSAAHALRRGCQEAGVTGGSVANAVPEDILNRMHYGQGPSLSMVMSGDGLGVATVGGGASASPPSQSVALSTPYFCFSENPLPCTMGRLVLHSSDVMVGEVPLTTSDLFVNAESARANLAQLRGAQDSCTECYEAVCSDARHGRRKQYVVKGVLTLQPVVDADFVKFDASSQLEQKVLSRPNGQDIVSGKMISCSNELMLMGADENDKCSMSNVLMIAPYGRVRPKPGDSGSVWVLAQGPNKGKAIAITCGYSRLKNWWIATLLHPNLEVLCAKYPDKFGNFTDFAVLPLQCPHQREETQLPAMSVLALESGDSGLSAGYLTSPSVSFTQ